MLLQSSMNDAAAYESEELKNDEIIKIVGNFDVVVIGDACCC